MLAAPLHPASSFSPLRPGEEVQCKPAKDLDAFNALLPPPIEFVEGSSTGMMLDETKYTAINASPRPKNEVRLQFLAARATSVPPCIDKINDVIVDVTTAITFVGKERGGAVTLSQENTRVK